MKQVAEEGGVGYVVEGSVRKTHCSFSAQYPPLALSALHCQITEAIVAAIEPQLYARESFRAQRRPPDHLDAWDLVMRGLSHYWRVTRSTPLSQPRKKPKKSWTDRRRRSRLRLCPVQRWRLRISSATMGRRGAAPMPGTSASTR